MNTDELKRSFLAFREQCVWLRCCYNTYAALYESGSEVREVLSASANIFFGDLNRILIEYCWLQMCKITDSATSSGRKNLTVEHINSLLESSSLMTDEISCHSEGLQQYRNLIEKGRHRLVAHLDKESVINGVPIGEHDQKDITAFFENLQGYVDAVGITVGVGPLDFRSPAGSGDVTDLINRLRSLTTAASMSESSPHPPLSLKGRG